MKNLYILSLCIFLSFNSFAQTELITSNANFYSGSSNWSKSGDVIISTIGSSCYSCPGYAILGVDNSGNPKDAADGTLERTITIPSNAKTSSTAYLYFYMYITTAEVDNTKAFDVLDVQLKNSSGQGYTINTKYSNKNKTTGYTKYSVSFDNIHDYAGKSMTLKWIEDSDGAKPTSFRIDDVSFMVEVSSSKPDLIVQEFPTLSSSNVQAGSSTTVSFNIMNQGSAQAGGSTTSIHLSKDNSYNGNAIWISDYSTSSIAASSSTGTKSKSVTIPSNTQAGNYYILVSADGGDDIDESKEDNQTTYVAITVTSAQQFGSLKVTLSPQDAINKGAQWKIVGGNWNSSGSTQSSLSVGSHDLEFKEATGYGIPSIRSVNITANNTTYELETYSYNSDPNILADVSVVDFMSTCVSLTKIFTITNTGNADLIVQPITNVPANYSTDLNTVATIQPKGTKQIYVTFSPNGIAGNYNGTLKINSNASNSPVLNITVNGTCNIGNAKKVELNRIGKSHLLWPFYANGSKNPITEYSNQDKSYEENNNKQIADWFYYNDHDRNDDGKEDHHLGSNYFAQDWNYNPPTDPNSDCGKEILAPLGGNVLYSSWENRQCTGGCYLGNCDLSSCGNYIIIQCTKDGFKDFAYKLCHMESINTSIVKSGRYIPIRSKLGTIGGTGADGAHLHFVLFKNIPATEMKAGSSVFGSRDNEQEKNYAADVMFDAMEDIGGDDETSYIQAIDENWINIYPNPSKGEFIIEQTNGIITFNKLIIVDMVGAHVYRQELTNTNEVIKANLASGIYTVILISDTGRISRRLVITN